MDVVASCKEKLGHFRVKELKDILTRLGLSKQGKKQDLIDRILDNLSDDQASKVWAKKHTLGKEDLVKLLDSTYSKMQAKGATDLHYMDHMISDNNSLRAKEETDDHFQSESRVRCLCGNTIPAGAMIKCENRKCNVWQHVGCVIIPENPAVGDPPFPDTFYCEICRLARADPFLVTVAHPLPPVKLTASLIAAEGSNPVQTVDRTFQITRADKDLLCKQEYDVQAWCMLLNDKVLYRMQWPQFADLQVNGVPVRAINRPGGQLLGLNGRDDGVIITACIKDGINRISLSGTDSRIFCLAVRIVKRRSLHQILSLIPKEQYGEPFEDALGRVRRCVGGGKTTDDADSDSDIELVAESIVVNLRCPMSGSRIKIAGRFKPCLHMGCFDLEIFVEMNQRSKKWQCPICLKNYALEYIIIDPYFNRITSKMIYCGEDVAEVEVKPDGSWRVKASSETDKRELGDLISWHFPDGSLCPPEDPKPKVEPTRQVKHEGASEGSTSLKLKRNSNGFWEVKKPDVTNNLSPGYRLQNGDPRGIPMSSSATGSGRDRDDLSVNQDGMRNFDISANNRVSYDSTTMRVETAPVAQSNADVIVLSDSEDDGPMMSSGLAFQNSLKDTSGVNFAGHPSAMLYPYPTDALMGTDGNSSLGLFSSNVDEYGMPMGYLPPDRAIPCFQSFESNGAPNELLDLQRTSLNHHTSSMNDYIMNPSANTTSAFLPGSNGCRAPMDINDGFDSLAFEGDDPSLQIFLPTRPLGASVHSDPRDHQDLANGIHTEDWISLRLGGGASCSQVTTAGIPLDSRKSYPSRESATNHLPDDGPLNLSVNGGRTSTTSKQRPNSPFSFPRQRRSVRPRLNFSFNSDSE